MARKDTKEKGIFPLVLHAVALAMGVAGIVLPILGLNQPVLLLLGIGLFCLALVEFEDKN